MRQARSWLITNLRLYQQAQDGKLSNVQKRLEFTILWQVETYEKEFGEPTGGDPFARQFGEAQSIARKLQSQLVPMSSLLKDINESQTNGPPK